MQKIIMVFILWKTAQKRKLSWYLQELPFKLRSTQDYHHFFENSSDNPIKTCKDLTKETDNTSTLDLDLNLNLDDNLDLNNKKDLDAGLDLDAINKIEKIEPIDKKFKSDKKEESCFSTLDNKCLTELTSRADNISAS